MHVAFIGANFISLSPKMLKGCRLVTIEEQNPSHFREFLDFYSKFHRMYKSRQEISNFLTKPFNIWGIQCCIRPIQLFGFGLCGLFFQ